MTEDADAPIEVGEIREDGLRYWQAKEAVRQAELHLAAQALVRTSMEARGIAQAGWCTTAMLAIAAAAFTDGSPAGWAAGLAGGGALFCAAALSALAIRPAPWAFAGFDPPVVMDKDLVNELQAIEWMASGYAIGIAANDARLALTGARLRIATWLLVASAPIAGLVYAVGRRLT